MKYPIALLALTAVTEASPVSIRQNPDDIFNNKQKLCKGWDLRTAEGVNKLWTDTAAGVSLELFIKTQWEHEHAWVKNLEDYIQIGTDGKSGASGCGLLGTDCNPMGGISCEDQFDKYGQSTIGKNSYWTFQAIKGMHSKFAELHRKLTSETIIEGLKIDQMLSAFGGIDKPPSKMDDWIPIAIRIGGVLGGFIPGVGPIISPALNIFGSVLGGTNLRDPKPSPAPTLKAAVADLFRSASVRLEDTLRIATGGGTNQDEYNSLPAPKEDTFDSKVAKMLNGGWFLLDDDVEAMRWVFSSIVDNLQRKIANEVMSSSGLRLIATKDRFKTREECTGPGKRWLPLHDGQEYCWYIMRQADDNWSDVTEDVYTNMASFGLGDQQLETYYKAIIDCALRPGDKKDADTSDMVVGQIPQCFFNLPAYFYNEVFQPTNCDSAFEGAYIPCPKDYVTSLSDASSH
ncbi:hypothetical protein FHETE_9738 [Fusarium heterosporum]|uniref:Uncharacterized protein n=1 Tax=Fusarium heterosporum TaxID=42747 RepID=A0A8H5SRM9_FUSHE|nr:hypothetical protein FHETE_9738 [Fusarium heterosporum]